MYPYHQEPQTVMTGTKVKRPGRSMKRRQNKRHRKINAYIYDKAAIIIQKRFRDYIKIRYKEKCPNNYDDCDYIDFEKVSTIPRDLIVSIDGTGYNAKSLLGWFCCKQVDPVTRKKVDDDIPTECAAKILHFMKNDHSLKRKGGHFKRYREFSSIIKKCGKVTLARQKYR